MMAEAEISAAGRLRLAPRLDMAAAPPLHAALTAARGRPLDIDLSGVERIGAQCAQLLVSARSSWAADGVALGFGPASPEARAQLAALGLENLILGAAAGAGVGEMTP